MKAADVVADGLRRAGAGRAFCADDADPTLVDALRAAGIVVVPTPRAASACSMAVVTGRLGDAPGVAVVSSDAPAVGRALATAARDHAPCIVLASRPPEHAPTKTTVVAGAESAAHWAAHAAQAAMSEPPGCVWLVISPDVATRPALPVATAARPAAESFDPAELETLVRAVGEAVRPMVVAGRGCRAPATAAWLRAFAEALPAPVLVTPAARGALPDPHPLCHGLLRADAGIVRRADVVLALGVDDVELASADVAFTAPVVRVGRIAALLEEVAPLLRDRSRADWDVAELDRLRRARPVPAVTPALATLVMRVREATPSGTAAVFPHALEPATMVWQSVQPGDVLVDEDVIAASAALALARPEGLVLVFGAIRREAQAELQRAGVEARLPEPGGVGSALERALAGSGPRIVAVPVPG